jgi:hypothetical protein
MSALRKVLFWLVILALPLHGIAGVTMMPSHESGHGPVQMQEGAAHGHPSSMAGSGMMKPSMKDCAELMADCGQLFGVMKCHLSAPCGLVAAPALHVASLTAVEPAATPLIMPTPLRIEFCTGAPERPPRLPS